MRAPWLIALAGTLGCGKQLNPEFCAAHPDDSRCLAARDAGQDATGRFDVAHLSQTTEDMLTSTSNVSILATTTIDTTTGTIAPGLSGALVIASIAQESGPPVMVIQAASFTIDANVRITGDKPLIIVATRDITVTGTLDAAADMLTAGAGGGQQTQGMGAGGMGGPGNNLADSGGGGGGFGTIGGKGGDVDQRMGGVAGVMYGGPTMLLGGSGGGRGAGPGTCLSSGGAGGGALQLSAGGTLTIGGAIDAGGGGGSAGPSCGGTNDGGAGGGGGSGGMIYLQARAFAGTGMLGANGGGGGGAASSGGGTPGMAGANATLTAGGMGGQGGLTGGRGGTGASSTTTGIDGMDSTSTDQNGGGGGGGAGRIYYQGPQPSYPASPPATSA